MSGIIAAINVAKDNIVVVQDSHESLSKRLAEYNEELTTLKETLSEIALREDDAWLTGGDK